MARVDFYFDFLSPYSYLATFRIERLESAYGAQVVWHAIDLEAARSAIGNTRQPAHRIPQKLAYLRADLARWAQRYGATLRFPDDPAFLDSARTIRLNRAFVWAAQRNGAAPFARSAFASLWEKGEPAADEIIRAAAIAAGLEAAACLAGVDLSETAAAWDRENREAQSRGVFGVPTFLVDDQPFWGNDRIDFLERYLKDPSSAVRS
jgi:2-hydroxychromene-2-carboxylate isomerase